MARQVTSRDGEYDRDVLVLTKLKQAVALDVCVSERWKDEVNGKLAELVVLLVDPEEPRLTG